MSKKKSLYTSSAPVACRQMVDCGVLNTDLISIV